MHFTYNVLTVSQIRRFLAKATYSHTHTHTPLKKFAHSFKISKIMTSLLTALLMLMLLSSVCREGCVTPTGRASPLITEPGTPKRRPARPRRPVVSVAPTRHYSPVSPPTTSPTAAAAAAAETTSPPPTDYWHMPQWHRL